MALHGSSWTDQWARIERWRERVRRTRDEGRGDGLTQDDCRDEMYALFQSIWHLKDWLINDSSVPVEKKAIDDWLDKSGGPLLIAADVANGSKHMLLTRRLQAGGSEHTSNSVQIHPGSHTVFTFGITDRLTGRSYEAVELADECLDYWRTYLGSIGVSG